MTNAGQTRRYALRLALGGVLGWSISGPLHAQSTVRFPVEPMRLTRRLTRGLAGGSAIIVTRSWRIVFTAQPRGIAINGQQISVDVEAPPTLEKLSAIEAGRSTAGMFPILLSPAGIIVAAGKGTTRKSIDSAMQEAGTIIASHGESKQDQAQHRRYLAQLGQTGSSLLEEMPGDLFFPSTNPIREVRSIALGDGAAGEFEIGWEASVHPGAAWLKSARREVITRIGSSSRLSSEDWSLTAL